MKYLISDLMNCKCQNVWHNMLSVGKSNNGVVEVDDKLANEILHGCEPSPPKFVEPVFDAPKVSPLPVPRDQWPTWAKALASQANETDKGIGDVIARVVGNVGGEIYKKWFEKITGQKCGCSERQADLNVKYPLKNNS